MSYNTLMFSANQIVRQESGMCWGKLGLEYLQNKIYWMELSWHTTTILNGMGVLRFAASVVRRAVQDFLGQNLVVFR